MELDIFSHLGQSAVTAEEVAHAIGADARGTRMLLDVLVSLGLVMKQGNAYAAGDEARFLVPSNPEFLSARFEAANEPKVWPQLTEVIRTGEPVERLDTPSVASAVFRKLIHQIHIEHEPRARRLAAILLGDAPQPALRVLDVAAGSGVWGIALARASEAVRVTAHDRPEILPTTKEYVDRCGLTNGFDYLPGDLCSANFGVGIFDIAIVGNIVHWEGEAASCDLFHKLYRAIRPGGRIVVIDMIPDDDRTGPTFALMFALNTLLFTQLGDTYTLHEYEAWLSEAGFNGLETRDIGSHSPVLITYKT